MSGIDRKYIEMQEIFGKIFLTYTTAQKEEIS